jgi:hypothetical protein
VFYFSPPKLQLFFHHVYHALHHKFTTIYHHVAPLNPQKPLQKRTRTIPENAPKKAVQKIMVRASVG